MINSPIYFKKKVKKASKPRNKTKISKEKMLEQETKMAKFNFTIILILALGCLLIMTLRNVKIDESVSELQGLEKEIASLEKENSQILVNIQNSLNLSNIETAAASTLGMQKLTNKQTVYVTLPKKDYVEPATEEVIKTENKNWFEEFVDKIFHR